MILWNIVSQPEPSGKESKGVVSDMFVCMHHDCRIWRWIELVATVEYLKPITVCGYHKKQKRQIPFGYALLVLTLSLTPSCSTWVGCGSLVDWPEEENKPEWEQISASLPGPDSHQWPNPIPHCLLWISSFQGWASRMFCGPNCQESHFNQTWSIITRRRISSHFLRSFLIKQMWIRIFLQKLNN